MTNEVSTHFIVKDIEKRLDRWGAKPQDPSGVKVEVDGEAPELVQFGSGQPPECCKPHPPAGAKGVEVFFTVSYRGHGGNPVERVRLRGLEADGTVTPGQVPGIWDLTPKEKKRSEKESVTHDFSKCVPCEAFTNDRTARFEIIAFDKNDNSSHQVMGVTVGAEQFKKCCGNVPRHPVRPIRKKR